MSNSARSCPNHSRVNGSSSYGATARATLAATRRIVGACYSGIVSAWRCCGRGRDGRVALTGRSCHGRRRRRLGCFGSFGRRWLTWALWRLGMMEGLPTATHHTSLYVCTVPPLSRFIHTYSTEEPTRGAFSLLLPHHGLHFAFSAWILKHIPLYSVLHPPNSPSTWAVSQGRVHCSLHST